MNILFVEKARRRKIVRDVVRVGKVVEVLGWVSVEILIEIIKPEIHRVNIISGEDR